MTIDPIVLIAISATFLLTIIGTYGWVSQLRKSLRERTHEILVIRALWLRDKALKGDIFAQRKLSQLSVKPTYADSVWADEFLKANPRRRK